MTLEPPGNNQGLPLHAPKEDASAGCAPSPCYAEVANKYDELCEIFAKYKLYAAAQKCQENAEAFRRCKTLVEIQRAARLNEA